MKRPSQRTALSPVYTIVAVTLLWLCGQPLRAMGSVSGGAGSSLLGEGSWIKVRVDTTGVYRLSAEFLASHGFSNVSCLTVAGYGSVERAHTLDSAPDGVPVIPVMRHDDGSVYFFAEGDRRIETSEAGITLHFNHYHPYSYYFVGERAGVSSPDVMTAGGAIDALPAGGDTISSHLHTVFRRFTEAHEAERGHLWHSRNFADGIFEQTFDTEDCDGDRATLYYSYIWNHSDATKQAFAPEFSDEVTQHSTGHNALIGRNSTTSQLIYSYRENDSATLSLRDGSRRFAARFRSPCESFSLLALSSCTLIYQRRNRGADGCRIMTLPHVGRGDIIKIGDADEGVSVWDVTDPRCPSALECHTGSAGTGGGHCVWAKWAGDSGGSARVVAFSADGDVREPVFAGNVTDCPSLTMDDDIDLLIVSTEALYPAACRLAEAHESLQGLRAKAVTQRQVMDEFASGAVHPNALRHLVMKLAQRPRPLRYLMLMGRGTLDPREEHSSATVERLVNYSTEDFQETGYVTKTYTPDLYYGITSEKVGASLAKHGLKATVSTGRLPVETPADAESYVDKCIAYLTDPWSAGACNHAIFSGGAGDASLHYLISENAAGIFSSNTASPTIYRQHLTLFDCDKSGHSDFATDRLRSTLALGPRCYIFNGHGGKTFIDHSTFTVPVHRTVSYGSLPLCVFASCFSTPIDTDSYGLTDGIISSNPGPIAVIGAGCEVSLNYNAQLVYNLVRYLTGADGGECLGDVFRLAVNATGTTANLLANCYDYNFIGDPALPRYYPGRQAQLTSVNGTDVDEMSAPTVVPELSRVILTGVVRDPSTGETDKGFCGSMRIDIYDASRTIDSKPSGNDQQVSIDIDEEIVMQTFVPVVNGEWSATLTVPATSRRGVNRMTLNAVSEDKVLASGGCRALSVTDRVDSLTVADTEPPIITLTVSADDDGLTDSDPIVGVEITDSGSGVSLNHSVVGGAPRIFLDGVLLRDQGRVFRASADGEVIASCQIKGASDGNHTVTVRARDVAGNSSERSVDFTVMNRSFTAALTASEHVAREEITFDLSHSHAGSSPVCRLVIRDIGGATVYSRQGVEFPFTWNLRTDGEGDACHEASDGAYRASVILDDYPYLTSTPEIEFAIVRRGVTPNDGN